MCRDVNTTLIHPYIVDDIAAASGGGRHFRLGVGGAGAACRQYGREAWKNLLHYVMTSTEKRSRGTLGYVQQAVITILKARGSENI